MIGDFSFSIELPRRIYCGFEDAIEVFDVHYPGEGMRLHTTPSKKSKDGLKGTILMESLDARAQCKTQE